MFSHLAATLTLALLVAVEAQQAGYLQPEDHPSLPIQKCTGSGSYATCKPVDAMVVTDANWRWLHSTRDTDTKCYDNGSWDKKLCPDGKTCAANCALEGVDYAKTLGVTTSGNSLTLDLVTGSNVGSRIYLLANHTRYYMFKLKNQELTFDVDLSALGCGTNAALYLIQMDEDGGMSKYPGNKAGAKYGTGYCDAQCATPKFISGEANIASDSADNKYGSCCSEVDILETNSEATAFTLHPCSVPGSHRCKGTECGPSLCDQGGCDFNPYRMGDKTFFGPGKTIDTTKSVTVVTQFITSDGTDNGDLIEVRRLWVQDGIVHKNSNSAFTGVTGNSLTVPFCDAKSALFGGENTFKAQGGMPGVDNAITAGMVLTFSIWLDEGAQMLWLDSNFPPGADPTKPGVARGPCSPDSGKRDDVLREQPNAAVTFSNIKIGDIGSTYSP